MPNAPSAAVLPRLLVLFVLVAVAAVGVGATTPSEAPASVGQPAAGEPAAAPPLATAQAAAAAPATAAPATPEVFVDQVEVRVVNLDVVVVDKAGNRVTGLGKDDFEVREDGKVVPITNFFAYDTPLLAPAPDEGRRGRPRRNEPPAVDPNAAAYAVDLDLAALPPPVVWAFYVDQARMDPGPRGELFKEMRTFAGRAVGPRDFALAASFDGQALRLLSPLAQGAAAADAALAKAAKQRGFTTDYASRRNGLLREIAQADVTEEVAQEEAARLLDAIDNLTEDEYRASRRAMDALRDLLAVVGGVEGRVVLVIGATGFDTRPGEALYATWRAKFGVLGSDIGGNTGERELDSRWADLPREFTRLIRSTNSGRFTVFTVQAPQLDTGRGPNISAATSGEVQVSAPIEASGVDVSALSQGSSLAAMAEATGGRTFVSGPDLDESLEVVRGDLASYYSLGYRPARADSDGFHEVDVRVKREGLRALHRDGVTVESRDEQAASSAVSALLAEGPLDNLFGAIVEAGAPTAAKGWRGKNKQVPLTVKVPLREVTLLPAGGSHQGKLRFHFGLRDNDGNFRRLESRPLTFSVPDDQLAAARGKFVSFKVEVVLEPGRYRFSASILDELGGVSGVAATEVVVAK